MTKIMKMTIRPQKMKVNKINKTKNKRTIKPINIFLKSPTNEK